MQIIKHHFTIQKYKISWEKANTSSKCETYIQNNVRLAKDEYSHEINLMMQPNLQSEFCQGSCTYYYYASCPWEWGFGKGTVAYVSKLYKFSLIIINFCWVFHDSKLNIFILISLDFNISTVLKLSKEYDKHVRKK